MIITTFVILTSHGLTERSLQAQALSFCVCTSWRPAKEKGMKGKCATTVVEYKQILLSAIIAT
jgi:hypothetical protein